MEGQDVKQRFYTKKRCRASKEAKIGNIGSFSVRCTHNCCVQVDITLSLTRTVKSRGNQVGIRCLAGCQSAYSVFTLMFMIEIT